MLIGEPANQQDNQDGQCEADRSRTPFEVARHPVGERGAKWPGHDIGKPEREDTVPMEITISDGWDEDEGGEGKSGIKGTPAQAIRSEISGCSA